MKKLIALLLAFCMVFACVATVSAENSKYVKQADALHALRLFQGTDHGYELEKSMTREQGVVMIIRLLGVEQEAKTNILAHPFTDTRDYTWVNPYLGYAYVNGITNGISETAFGYGQPMSDAMFLTMLLRVLGYKDANDGSADFVWNNPYALAKTAGICDGKEVAPFLRDDMVLFCWNALSAKLKGTGKTLCSKLIEDGVFTKSAYDAADKIVNPAAEGGSTIIPSGGGGGNTQPAAKPEYADSVSLSSDTAMVYVGSNTKISAILTPSDVQNKTVTWTSDDPAIATVSDGLIHGVSAGTTQIRATYHGITVTCSVVVNNSQSTHENETPRIPIH